MPKIGKTCTEYCDIKPSAMIDLAPQLNLRLDMSNTKLFFLSILFTLTAFSNVEAEYKSWGELSELLKASGGDPKALGHLACFYEQNREKTFDLGPVELPENRERCAPKSDLKIERHRVVALIDYNKPSNVRRMFLIDRKTGGITTMAVAHGRYKAWYLNFKLRENKNSVKWAKYFSNELGSNAPSSGFFVAGQDYEGKFGRSLALFGLEAGINDRACDRNVVIHKHKLVTPDKAYYLSSGCPMIAPSQIDHVIELLKGESDEDVNLTRAGGLVFIYGPREKAWARGTCPAEVK